MASGAVCGAVNGVQKAEGAAAAPPPLLQGRCACDSNINPHTLHLDFAHDQAPAPGGGSEARQSTAGRGTNQPDACADAQGKRMEARCGGALCARESVLVGGVRRRAPLRRNGDRRTTCGQVRIQTDTPAFAASLAEYLRRCEYMVEVVDRRIIDATARQQSSGAPYADIELDGYLAVWQAMHPECSVERLTPHSGT
jgi:hypothetical protein